MTPKKTALEAAKENGTIAYVDKCVSAAYLLIETAWTCICDAEDRLKENRLTIGETKQALAGYQKSHDKFQGLIKPLVDSQGSRMAFFEDYEKLEELVRQFVESDK